MTAAEPPSEPTRPDRARRSGAVWLGALGIFLLSSVAAGPYALARYRGQPGRAPARRALPPLQAKHAEMETAKATSALASLASALGALNEVRAKVSHAEAPVFPPLPEDFPSPTACARSYLPGIDVEDQSLGVLCKETDLWTTERKVYVRLAHRRGGGAFTRLGRHSLAALAAMRSGCCVSPEPLTAVVPGLWCGILRDELRTLGPSPDARHVADYESTMRCLAARGAHLPDRFESGPPETSQAAFDDFLRIARHRSKR